MFIYRSNLATLLWLTAAAAAHPHPTTGETVIGHRPCLSHVPGIHLPVQGLELLIAGSLPGLRLRRRSGCLAALRPLCRLCFGLTRIRIW